MREVVYYVATTLDGYIARPDGSFSDFPWDDDFIGELMQRFPETMPAPMRPDATREQNRRFGAVVMGRRTYEVGADQGLASPYPTLDQFVVSRTMSASPDPAVTLVRKDPVDFLRELTTDPGMAIWICGGSELATPLFKAGLVDRLILKVNPVVFGEGIPLLLGAIDAQPLTIEDTTTFRSGHMLLEYRVGPAQGGGDPTSGAGVH